MKKSIALLAAGLLCLLGTPASAQEGKSPWEEYDKLINTRKTISALGPDLFGDNVDLQSGALSFSATDVSIPGNSKLPVALARKFSVTNRKGYYSKDLPFADWDLDTPRLSGVFASAWHDQRCSIAQPPATHAGDKYFYAEDFWQGNNADMPGGGVMLRVLSGGIAPATGGPYLWMTSGNTYFSCLSTIKNGTGEGFLAITADGTKYWFDWMARYVEPTLDSKTATGSPIHVARRKNVLYATRVEDRFGNWVTYTYTNTYNAPARLTAINSNDGRQLTLGYNANGQIASVSDGSHTWTYQYNYPTSAMGTLTAVVQPDATQWSIDFAALSDAAFHYNKSLDPDDPWRSCFSPGDILSGAPATGTITHPSGAVGAFTVSIRRHGRSNVPALCANYTTPSNDPTDDIAYYPINWDSYSLTQKTVSGLGLTTASWAYGYGSTVSWFYPGGTLPVCTSSGGCEAPRCTSDACAGTDLTIVTGPDSHYTRYTFGNSYRYNEGKLLKVEEGSSSTAILRTTSTTYNLAQSGQPYPTPIGDSPQSRGDGFTSEYLRPQVSRVIAQEGVTFSSAVNSNSFDSFARPLSITKSSSLGYSKVEATTYSDNLSLWVLGQVSKTTVDGLVANEAGYDTLARPTWHKTFGKLTDTLTYNTDGTLATAKDGNNNVTTLSSWYRGVPRSIKYPATPEAPTGAIQSAVVDSNGWITAVTDETGAKTCYDYDAMGRVNKITYPSETQAGVCDASAWTPTTITFVGGNGAAYGVPAGHWRQTTLTGNGRHLLILDALWRPIVDQTLDLGNVSGTAIEVIKRYDSSGRAIFQSYPRNTAGQTVWTDPALTGTHTAYDALDRVTQVQQESELGLLTTTTTYLDGFQRRTTNPRGFASTETFQVFDTPSYDAPTQISQPEGVVTGITRDKFGKPLQLIRTGPVN